MDDGVEDEDEMDETVGHKSAAWPQLHASVNASATATATRGEMEMARGGGMIKAESAYQPSAGQLVEAAHPPARQPMRSAMPGLLSHHARRPVDSNPGTARILSEFGRVLAADWLHARDSSQRPQAASAPSAAPPPSVASSRSDSAFAIALAASTGACEEGAGSRVEASSLQPGNRVVVRWRNRCSAKQAPRSACATPVCDCKPGCTPYAAVVEERKANADGSTKSVLLWYDDNDKWPTAVEDLRFVTRGYGCSECRWSRNGCGRCRAEGFRITATEMMEPLRFHEFLQQQAAEERCGEGEGLEAWKGNLLGSPREERDKALGWISCGQNGCILERFHSTHRRIRTNARAPLPSEPLD